MLPSEIKERISDYINYWHDAAYVAAIFDEAGIPAVSETLETMVSSGNRREAQDALLFAEDAIRFRLAPRLFGDSYRRSGLLAAVRHALYAPDYFIRNDALATLGRVGPHANARCLAAAFPWYLEHDPLALDHLLVQCWLDRRVCRREQLEQFARAPLYLTRWAAVETLWKRDLSPWLYRRSSKPQTWSRQLLRRLAQDRHPWVRAEATWCLGELAAIRRALLSRQDLAGLDRAWSRVAPKPSFSEIRHHVSNYLSLSGERDYDVSLVEAVVQHLRQRPITPGSDFDIHAYWSPLAASRSVLLRR